MRTPARLLLLGWFISVAGLSWAEKKSPPQWPLKFEGDAGVATVYQPQLESFKDNRLTGRSAVSVLLKGEKTPVFGAVWLVGRVTTDREKGLVTVTSVEVTDVKAPEVAADGFTKFKKFLSDQLTQSQFVIPLAQLTATLEAMGNTGGGDPGLSTTPPEILFRTQPAVLMIMDGDPKTQPIEEGKLVQVVNTAEILVQVSTGATYYLWTDDGWIGADKLEGPWSAPTVVPAPVEELGKKLAANNPESKKEKKTTNAVEVIIRRGPAELFVTKGKPQFEPLKGANLLHVANSDQDILMDINSQDIYVVASGRWYKSKKTEGPWTYVPSDKLPEEFSNISPNSPRAGVLPFIAGTPEARDAVLDASVPQTAAVKKGPADVKVTYDGAPKWKPVEGMEKKEISYAENTAEAIFKVKNRYYLCKEAVWYEAAQPEGPWSVAVSIPPELNKLPPSCPNYQCSYVYIYESTPDVVYVGYTPGYMGCYVYGATVVYGTGYYYPPYYGYGYGGAYYARPMTYGYHAYYNPATGWGAVGYRGPNGGVAISGPVGGWGSPGGPGGIGGPGNPGGPGGIGGPGGPGGPGGVGGPGKPGNGAGRPSPKQGGGSKGNLYGQANRGGAAVQPTTRPSGGAGTRPANMGSSAGGKNNVYADPSGNVHRQNSSGGWESQSSGKWSPSQSSSMGQNGRDLDRQSQTRQNSSRQSSGGNYSGSRGSSGGGYSGSHGGGGGGSYGGSRGGGGRGGGGGRR